MVFGGGVARTRTGFRTGTWTDGDPKRVRERNRGKDGLGAGDDGGDGENEADCFECREEEVLDCHGLGRNWRPSLVLGFIEMLNVDLAQAQKTCKGTNERLKSQPSQLFSFAQGSQEPIFAVSIFLIPDAHDVIDD